MDMMSNDDLAAMYTAVLGVYDRYSHLDALLSDPGWIDPDSSPQRRCLFDLWQVVRNIAQVQTTQQ